jgi:hypothetical protein
MPRFCGVAWVCISLDVERGDMAIVYKNSINVSPPTIMTHVKHFGTIGEAGYSRASYILRP